MKVMKTYRQIMLFAALFFSFEAVTAQSAHIGDGSLGTSVIDSMVYSRDSVIAGQPHRVYDMYVRACEYYTWNGHRESASVVKTPILCYNDNFTRDSLVSLHLTVKRLGYATYTPLPECDSIEFRGRWYTQSYAGNYSMVQNENIYSVDGCDSVYFLSLTVRGHSTEKVYTLENCNTFSWPIPWVLNIDPVPRVYTSSTSDTVHTLNVDGCDSTIVLNLTVWYGDTLTDTQNVCDRYTWAGHTYTSSTVADHHFRTVHNCDSLVTLDLTVRHSTSALFSENVCDSMRWMGGLYTSTGTYRDTIPNTVGCDSLMTLSLTVRNSTHNAYNQRACDSYQWSNNGWSQTYTVSGLYTHPYTNAAGCSSEDTLHLDVRYSNSGTDVQTACDSYTWIDGHNYTASTTTPTVVFTNSDQCDSTVTLNLTVNYSTERRDTVIACYSYLWPVNGVTYTSLGTRDLEEHTTNAVGCDSTMRLHLSIISYNTDTTRVETCNSYTWHGKTYTSSTIDTDTLVNRFGCDSLDVLVLTIHHDQTATDPHTACDSYRWIDGVTYTASNNSAQYHLSTVHGCDSLVTLNLIINHSNSAIENVDACESYTWHGGTYNASTTTPTYHCLNAAGCDSTTTLHLTIWHADHSGTATANECDSFTWNGTRYTTSGHYPYHTTTVHGCDSTCTLDLTIRRSNVGTDVQRVCDSLRWHGTLYTASTNTPTFTETNAAGCDSVVTLRLTVNYSTTATDSYNVCDSMRWHGTLYTATNNTATYHTTNARGCDSTTTLNLVVRHSTVAVDVHSVCDRYTWINGQTYTSDNHTALYDAGNNAAGCDSTVRLDLTVRKSSRTTLPAVTRCDSYLWPTDGMTYTVSGIYRDTLTNGSACDSIVTLPLTIHYSFNTTDVQQACDTYTWTTTDADGSGMHTYGPFTSSTTQTAVQRTVEGCDSTITLHLTVYHSDLTGSDTRNVCDSLVWNGTPYNASGDYPYHTQTTHGCDSSVTLHLTVRYSTTNNLTENVCDSYTWHGTPYTDGGRFHYTYPIPNAAGCDSTEELNLTIRRSTSSVRIEDVCDSFRWDATGALYTASANPTALLTNAAGCDSNLTLHLTVRHSSESTMTVHGCDHYVWHGVSYSTDTTVDWHTVNAMGCDSVEHLSLTMDATIRVTDYVDSCQRCTWNGRIYYTNNTTDTCIRQSVAGCDSITTLHLTIHQPGTYYPSQVACDSFYWAGTMYYLSGTKFHTFTDQWDCDSTVVLSLTIHHSDENTVLNRTACDSYTWNVNGQTYTSTAFGVRDTLQTSYGCDSVVTLNLTVNYSTSSSHTADVCDSYTWHGRTYTATGTDSYTHRGGNSVGCDSTENLTLTVRYSTSSSRTENVCDSFLWDATGLYYTSSNRYSHTLNNANAVGCDSNLTLHLTVRRSTDSTLTPNVCDTYTWHGTTYTASTSTPQFDTVNAVGCDSTARLHLTVRYSTTAVDVHNECDSYTWHGTTHTASTSTPTYHTLNAAGCDSTATLNLTIRYSTSRTDTADYCDRFTWTLGDGNTYSTSTTTPTWQVPGGNTVGCDSVAHLNLTIRRSTSLDTNVIACDSYTFRGNTYTNSTVYPEVITNAVGCDSTITLHLTIDYTSVYNDVHDTCDTYTWTDGVTYTASTTTPVQHLYTVVGHCDSTSHLHLTIRHSSTGIDLQSSCDSFLWAKNSMTYYASNNRDTVHLTNSEMCDSLLTLNLTVYHSDHITDTQNVCDSLLWHGTTYYANTNSARWEDVNTDGCDSIVTLNLTVRYSTMGVDQQNVCDSLRWLDGNLYTADNHTAQATINNMAGCDSLVTLNLTVRYNSNTPYTVTACDQYLWPRNNYLYNRSLTDYYSYSNAVGCPSVDTLYLTVNPSSHLVFNETVCDTFTWRCHDIQMDLDSSGTYFHNYTNEYNCPSADTLHLSVNYNTSTSFTVDSCDSYTWHNHGWDTTLTASCTVLHEYNTAAGCPSVDTLYLTIRYSSHLAFTETACDSFHWDCHDHHQDYFTSGDWYHTYLNTAGCPSADTLHLTVNHNTNTAYTMTACDNYTWYNHGNTMGFDSTGTYINGYLTADGCPSADTLYLTVNHNTNTAFDVDSCDSYTWHNHGTVNRYTQGGVYYNGYNTAEGCPSVDTLRLTLRYNSNTAYVESSCDTFVWRNHDSVLVYTTHGDFTNPYINAVGCPSVDTLHLTIRHNSDSVYVVEACDQYYWPSDSITYTFSINTTTDYINAAGCLSTDSLSLTIHYNTNTGYADTACDMYVWMLNHTAYNSTGTYYRTYMNADSVCQNVDTLYLTIYHNTNTLYSESACDTFHWVNHGLDTVYTGSGRYHHDYLTADGCPSTDTLQLTVNYNTDSAFTADVCDSYTWSNHGHDTTFTQSGIYLNDYSTAAGCPSTDTLFLTVRYNSNVRFDTTVCDSLVRQYNATTAITYRTSGTYVYPYINDVGCPSTDSLILTVNHNTSSHIYRQSCKTFYWQRADITYTFSGVFDTAYLTAEGCPSHDTLSLTIDQPVDSVWYVTDCDIYVWPRNRTAYNTSGTKVYGPYMVPENVCQNYDTLFLTLFYANHNGQDTLEVCDSVLWHDSLYTTTGTYPFDTLTVHGCDSTVTLDLTIHTNSDTLFVVGPVCDYYIWNRDSINFFFDTTGLYHHRYTNQWGCPSHDSLEVTIVYKSDTTYVDTACDQYTWLSLYDPSGWTQAYTASAVDTHSYINADGCPSIDTLLLTLYISPRTTEVYRACDSLLWRDGNVYYATTDLPRDTTPSNEWCDSIISLDLTVNYSIVIDSVNYFCDSSSFIYHDSVIYTPGIYDYRGRTSEGCDSTVHLDLIQLPRPVLSLEENHSCETYEYTLTILVEDTLGLAHTYSWWAEPDDLTLRGQENESTVVVHPVRNTAYSVSVDYDILPTCSSVFTSDTLVPIMQPHAAIQTTPPFVQANDISFRAEDKSIDYTEREWWVNGTYYSDEKVIQYSAPASEADSVALMLVSKSPTCTDTAYLLVPIHNFTIYVPNVFTPTEPSNQIFKVFARSVGEFEMWIYTREGLLVYHTNDIHAGWDGRHNGQLCQQGAYVYHIRYTYVVSPEAWHTATGTVTLLR